MPTLPAIPQTPFEASLLPASFGGVPFAVLGNQVATGRRLAVHEYPFRDVPYSEDLGRRARRISFSAFVIGDDVAAQTAALLIQCEVKGPQLLVHPTFGMAMWICETCETTESWDKGRYVEFRLGFVEPGLNTYPTNSADTQAGTNSAADNAASAAGQNFSNNVAAAGASS
jgi:prophage DNA circulation protein